MSKKREKIFQKKGKHEPKSTQIGKIFQEKIG